MKRNESIVRSHSEKCLLTQTAFLQSEKLPRRANLVLPQERAMQLPSACSAYESPRYSHARQVGHNSPRFPESDLTVSRRPPVPRAHMWPHDHFNVWNSDSLYTLVNTC